MTVAAMRRHVASRRLEREVAGHLAWDWQARWPDWPATTPRPGEPQGSPISGSLVSAFLTAFNRSLEQAGIVFPRSLDDVTIPADSPAALAGRIGVAKSDGPRQATGASANFRTRHRSNELFGYELTGRQARRMAGITLA